MQSIPRPILTVVAALLGLAGLFGLASGVTTGLGRSGPPQSAAASDLRSGDQIQEAQPLDSLAPPPPPVAPEKTEEEKAAEEAKKAEEEKKKKEAAAQAKADAAALPDAPEPYAAPSGDTGPAEPPPEPDVNAPPAQGPALY